MSIPGQRWRALVALLAALALASAAGCNERYGPTKPTVAGAQVTR